MARKQKAAKTVKKVIGFMGYKFECVKTLPTTFTGAQA
jgi:hypothetical protein